MKGLALSCALQKHGGTFPPYPLVRSPLRRDEKRLAMPTLKILGGAEGDRTPDPKTASLVLSQLSYSPTCHDFVEFNLTSAVHVVKKKDGFLVIVFFSSLRGAFLRAGRKVMGALRSVRRPLRGRGGSSR